MSVNKAIILGYIGADPEYNLTASGVHVCKFSVATSEKYKDKETTEWHRVTAFAKQAEIIRDHFHKGDQIYIEGRIKTDKWEDASGVTKYSTGIILSSFSFVGSKSSRPDQPLGQPDINDVQQPEIDAEDIPF